MAIQDFNIHLLKEMLNAIREYGIYMIDPNGVINSWNKGAERIKGYKEEEVIGKNFSMFYTEEDRKKNRPKTILKASIEKGTIEDLGWRVRKDGSRFWADVVISPIYDEQGKHIGFSKVTRDVSKSLETEELQKILDSLRVLTWVSAPNGKIIYYNKQWKNFSGLENIPNNELEIVVHPQDRERTMEKWRRSVNLGKEHFIEHRFLDKNKKTHWMETTAYPIKNDMGEIQMWVGSSIDISDQKKALEAKDEMLSFTAHELKTPITTIKAYIELIKRCKENKLECDEINYLEKTHILINRLSNLVSEMNEITKIEAGKFKFDKKPFRLDQIVLEAIKVLQTTNSTHEMVIAEKEEITVCADRSRIEQVLTNYISNAIKYSPNCDYIEISVKTKDNFAIFSVKDCGIGIPKEEQESIFKKFRRAKNTGAIEGLGLGLYLCKELIEAQEGKVWFESKENKGSTFYFSLPVFTT